MKILKIAFQNINSLRGSHEIDFSKSPFTTGSLFAITGPTGSGKSTILDVISLALFNHVPRIGKITKKEIMEKGALLTRNQKEAFASVSYACAEGNFTSKWSIAINRNNNLNDYEMEICHFDSGELLDCKKSEVPSRNEELIGLNYNQFIKSVVLAQGEFAQFLKAKKDERGELLEKITGTGIYRNLGIRAYDKFREVNREIKTRRDNILFLQENLLEADVKSVKKAELAEKEAAYAPIEAKLKSLEGQIELKGQIRQQKEEVEQLQAKKLQEDEHLQVFNDTHGGAISAHEKVQNHADELRNWSRQQEEIEQVKSEFQKISQEIYANKSTQTESLKKVAEFTQQEITAENIESALYDFSQRINALQQQRTEKGVDYKNLKAQLSRELQEISFLTNDKNPEEDLKQLKNLQLTLAEEVNKYSQNLSTVDLQNISQEKTRLSRDLEAVFGARQLAEQMKRLEKEQQELLQEEQELNEQSKSLPQSISVFQSKQEALKEKLQRLQTEKENKELRASLEEHRAKLKDGEPCPLCGALHHPFAKDQPEDSSQLPAFIQSAAQELEAVQKQLTEAESQQKLNKQRVEKLLAIKKQQASEVERIQQQFISNYKQFTPQRETGEWEAFIQEIKVQLQHMEAYEKVKLQLKSVNNALPIQKQLIDVVEEGKSLKQAITELYTGNDIFKDTNRLQQNWTALQQEAKSLNAQQSDLTSKAKTVEKSFQQLENVLTKVLTDVGFASISEARQALLPDAEYNSLREEREQINRMIAQYESALDVLTKKLKLLHEKDVKEPVEELSVLLQSKKENAAQLRQACENLRRSLKNDDDKRSQIESIKSEIADKEKKTKRWRLLNELIGDATGKKFNDFAQDLSLSQLLVLANTRLKDLSDRYRIDKPAEAEDDSLVAIDEHMGGQRRSVKTLSGGETFLLSLSLALALSDMASRNIEINSLFIDEGFGTLDPETLDQTLDTLEKLQAESSKTIGIISHVDSLKERIATQIQLKRHGQGYSTLEII